MSSGLTISVRSWEKEKKLKGERDCIFALFFCAPFPRQGILDFIAQDSLIRVFPEFERARGLNCSNQLRQGLTILTSWCGNRTVCHVVMRVLAILTGRAPVQKTGKQKLKLKLINWSWKPNTDSYDKPKWSALRKLMKDDNERTVPIKWRKIHTWPPLSRRSFPHWLNNKSPSTQTAHLPDYGT